MSLWHQQQQSIAQGCLTNSKSPVAHVFGVTPTHVVKASGCKITDEYGKTYIDFVCGLGTNLFGYGNESINRAMHDVMRNGYSHSFATPHEIKAAEKVKEMIPFIDKVKFVKSGSDACSAAVKIARAHTGRELVLSSGYHGWDREFCDAYNGTDGSIKPFTWDLMACHPAAVIIEPVETDWSDTRREWLWLLKQECNKRGIVLIFDEVITGFRWPKYSVSTYWNIEPDLICLGKAMANGMPLACVGGKAALLDNPSYFVSSTYGGEILSLAAAHQAMTMLQVNRNFSLETLWNQGQEFIDSFNLEMAGIVQIKGYPTRGVLVGDDLAVALFMQEACKAGLIFGKSWFYNFKHHEYKDQVMKTLEGVSAKIRDGKARLEGEMPRSPLAAQVRKA